MKKNDDDPIVKFERKNIFNLPKKNFENDIEYEYNDYDFYNENEENIKAIKEGKRIVKSISISIIVMIAIIILYFIMYQARKEAEVAYVNERSSYVEEGNEEYNYAHATDLTHNNIELIPTLYKWTGYDKYISVENTKSDIRFGDDIATTEITYESIPEKRLENYTNKLIEEEFYYVGTFENGYIYAKNLKVENIFGFVIIRNDRIIYGVGSGDYEIIFK